jgi:hypothetical protein
MDYTNIFFVFIIRILDLYKFIHSCYNTNCKTQNPFGTTSNAKKFNFHSLLPFFCLGPPAIFVLHVHFFKHLVHFLMALFLYIHVEAITIP